jgi:hypothetical protein
MKWEEPVIADVGGGGPCHCPYPETFDGPCSGGTFDEPVMNPVIYL